MSAPAAKPPKPKKKDKERLSSQPPSNERLKAVVRRLPPNLPEEIFWQSVQPWVTDETVTWKAFFPGKLRKRPNKENVPSRAYIAFKTEEQLAQFGREYDGHLYRDKAGNESYAVVEFAPYQKVPSDKKKVDARSGTLDKDEDYISFLESLNAEPSGAEPVSLESLSAHINQLLFSTNFVRQLHPHAHPRPPKTTPLLEALKAEKAAQKEKESAIRQIAQQKKKNAAAAAAATASTSGAPLSKKAAKKAAAAAAAAASAAPKPGAAGPSKSAAAGGAARQQARVPGPPAVPTDVAVASAAGTTAAGEPPAAAPRRTRPVIGFASRQFEAALSGAGVAPAAGGAGAGAEHRKSRRERERERAAAAAAAAGTEEAAVTQTRPPPRREKPPRRKDSVSGGVAVSNAAGGSGEVRILQRAPAADPAPAPVVAPVIVHRIDGDVTVQPQAGVIPVNIATANANANTSAPPRGGGRGRGGRGGRGRGGVVGGGVPVSRGGG
ncbi:Regulator of nonsense transcripts UPF3 [Mycena sanguinolenta]|uniref:Regulator of nonsense transcripts UPF3 n=1 Tax=Mycena sanguinolenta TaxID=230812 RepID=A0A8H6XUE6_9AGAR|nr:Regulator of nonsense transcripts UPF3 [Mycena sanguinolenta]